MPIVDLLEEYLNNCYQNFLSNGQNLSELEPYASEERFSLSDEALRLPLLIPSMLRELSKVMRQEATSPRIRAIAGGVYSYVFNPFDYIDEESLGYLGFLDDALIVFNGMRFIENMERIKFSSTQDQSLQKMINECETFINPNLVNELKMYAENLASMITSQ
ncbi:MAG: DUF1232 domain-containing protein [Pseudanabaenaceae cyanobacterium]